MCFCCSILPMTERMCPTIPYSQDFLNMTLVIIGLPITLAKHKNSQNALIGQSRMTSYGWLDSDKVIYHRAGEMVVSFLKVGYMDKILFKI